jgi:PAS domain S-box-containing protein
MNKEESHLFPTQFTDGEKGLNERQKTEQTFFKYFFYDSPSAIYSCDKEGYITYYNQAAVELWGREPELGKDLWCGSWKIYTPDGLSMPLSECPMALVLKEGRAYNNHYITIETPNHIFKELMVCARPIFDENQRQIGAHNTLIDITENCNKDKKQAMLSAIVEFSDHAIISKDLNGIITSWNTGAQKIFGYTEAEIIGQSINILVPDYRRSEETQILHQIRNGYKVDHLQTIRVAKDGHEIPISLTVSPVKDSSGKIIGASKIARDISEEVRALKAIKQNTENLEMLNSIGKVILEKLDVKIILQQVTDVTTKITGAEFGAFFYNSVNEDGEEFKLFTIAGAQPEAFEKIGMPRNTAIFDKTFHQKKVVRSDDITKDVQYGKNAPHFGMPKGHLPVVSYLAVPVISTYGTIIGGLMFGHREPGVFKPEHEDIIGSIASQAAVALDNSRLFEEVTALSAKKDEFIALASHELKTPLTSIKGYLQISSRSEKDKVGHMFIQKALSQVEKLNTLVTDLLDSSKIVAGKLQFNFETFDIQKLIIDVIETYQYANTTHQLIYTQMEDEFIVEADKQRIEQVMINLLSNAIKYSPKADKVYVSITMENGLVKVMIRDEGIGLNITQKNKIFTRFYRAEGPTNISGLGLGLYLTKEIIDRHNGSIDVNTELEKGTEFYFTLPLKN